ncbi:spermidine synthase [Caldivirga sp. UBA161]|uniref:spermine/spermidine synthase domain-containing protein n=1 Tax=Caldivirga sp. UBA161 TaxID=1915569 RepID=UPI0025BD95EB|nr:spermidine synthase [Caldivirga sp. UBA161]
MSNGYVIPMPLQCVQYVAPHTWAYMSVRRVLVNERTKYQHVLIVELEDFGKALFLDGILQSAQVDEYIYHESLVHPAMVAVGKPERVLILGTGEGAALREVVKYSSVKEVITVDIDYELIKYVKEYLKEFHNDSFKDPRVKEIYQDAVDYVRNTAAAGEKFDVIVMDLTDPYGSEIGAKVYSVDVIKGIYSMLNDNGALIVQAGSSFLFPKEYRLVYDIVKLIFPLVTEYQVWVPSFMYAESFILATKGVNPVKLSSDIVDAVLRVNGVKTRFYNGKVHSALMTLGSYSRT